MEGEDVVTILILLRVALGVQTPWESCALIALAFAALFVSEVWEGRNAEDHQLAARPGTASGIVLGSIIWPVVLTARLHLQLGDASLVWEAMLCSTRLLLMILWPVTGKPRKIHGDSLSLFGALLCGILASRSANTALQSGCILAVELLLSVVCFRAIFRAFPASMTLGEAFMVSTGLSIYAGSVLKFLIRKGTVDIAAAMLQVAVLGVISMPAIYQICMRITKQRKLVSFALSVLFVILVLAPGWVLFILGKRQHPFLWLIDHVMDQPLQRLGFCIYWMVLAAVLPLLYLVAQQGVLPQILLRKLYHLLAVLMFVPPLIIQAQFLRLAFALAFVVFSLAEMIRVWQISVLARRIDDFMIAFADSRDSDRLIISHFSLLLGCALPVWLHANAEASLPLPSFAGILGIGIGDTMASCVGYNYGTWRLSKTNKKTVEGTLAGVLSMTLGCIFLQQFFPGCNINCRLSTFGIAALFTGLLEAYTTQLDNAFIPLVFYALLCL